MTRATSKRPPLESAHSHPHTKQVLDSGGYPQRIRSRCAEAPSGFSGLDNRRVRKSLVSSNLTLSAKK
jgi:hypothetical protein